MPKVSSRRGGSGSDNLRTVTDIAARDALTPNSDETVLVLDASGDPDISSGSAWYQYDDGLAAYLRSSPVPASESVAGVLPIASAAEAAAGTASNKFMTPERVADAIAALSVGLVGKYASAAAIEAAKPAASNTGRFAWVDGGNAYDGWYYSDGATWEKVFDDSGDRTTLFSYGAGVTYGATNRLSASGTSYHRNVTDSADVTPLGGSASDFFDGSTAPTYYRPNESPPNITYKIMDTAPNALGRFIITLGGPLTGNTNTRVFELFGRKSDGTIEYIPIISATTTGTPNISIGNGEGTNTRLTLDSDSTTGDIITVNTGNTTQYAGYGMLHVTNGALGYSYLAEMEGYETTDATSAIDIVSAINKLAKGHLEISSAADTASAVDLEVSSEAVHHSDTTSNSVTYTLPAVAEIGATGKVFVIKVDDATNNTIIDGDGAETINGSTTQTLDTAGEVMCVQCNGTSWDILFHYDPSATAAEVETAQSSADAAQTTANNALAGLVAGSTVADITARDALSPTTGDIVEVTDSGDGTTRIYEWNGSSWVDVTGDYASAQNLNLAQRGGFTETTTTLAAQTSDVEVDMKGTSEVINEVIFSAYTTCGSEKLTCEFRLKKITGNIYLMRCCIDGSPSLTEILFIHGFDVTGTDGYSVLGPSGGAFTYGFSWDSGRVYITLNYISTTYTTYYSLQKR